MKLNINAKELLALHNLLRDYALQTPPSKYSEGEPLPDDEHLRRLNGRIRAILVASIDAGDNRPVTPFTPAELAFAREQAKIEKLKDELNSVKKEQVDIAESLKDKDFFVPDPDDDLQLPEYPRKSHRKGGNGGGRKK